jgi:hypothetical protein
VEPWDEAHFFPLRMGAILTGKVFISCGMASSEERNAALRVRDLLQNKFGFKRPYVAITVQSLDDIMTITKELRSSDYYLFIDFKRHSTFTHQELALAHHLGFGSQILALRQKGRGARRPQGFLRYVLSHPPSFDTVDDLLAQVENLVRAKGWNPDYSRNLVLNPSLTRSCPIRYGDHTGESFHESWRAHIHNNRPDVAAFGTICMLHSILDPSGNSYRCDDRAYLKWAGHGSTTGYERTVLPEDSEVVDVFAVRQDQPGLFLLSTLDSLPRKPIVTNNGDYELTYRVFSRDFPLLEFTLMVHLRWQPTAAGSPWTNHTEAEVKR